jgi:hypothetical protein
LTGPRTKETPEVVVKEKKKVSKRVKFTRGREASLLSCDSVEAKEFQAGI